MEQLLYLWKSHEKFVDISQKRYVLLLLVFKVKVNDNQ